MNDKTRHRSTTGPRSLSRDRGSDGRKSLGAHDGERRDFHRFRSAPAPPADTLGALSPTVTLQVTVSLQDAAVFLACWCSATSFFW